MKNFVLLLILLIGKFTFASESLNEEISGDFARGVFGILYCKGEVKFSLDGYMESKCGFTEPSSDTEHVRIRSAHNRFNLVASAM